MRYLLCLLVLMACNSKPKEMQPRQEPADSLPPAKTERSATATSNEQEQANRDSSLLDAAMQRIRSFPEVEAANKTIMETSKGQHGIAILQNDQFGEDSSYYAFSVGDNSQEDRFINLFTFLLERKTGKLKYYDPVTDSVMSLSAWREGKK